MVSFYEGGRTYIRRYALAYDVEKMTRIRTPIVSQVMWPGDPHKHLRLSTLQQQSAAFSRQGLLPSSLS